MAPDTSFTHYEVLQVSPDATAEELRVAYRRAQRRAHPDLDGHPVLFRMVQAAWQVLSDPEQRARYDEGLRSGAAAGRARTAAGPATAPGPGAPDAPRPEGDPLGPATEPDLWLADHRHWPTGLPYGRLLDAPAPHRLAAGAWVVAGHGSARSPAYVRRNDGVHVLVDLPPRGTPVRSLLASTPGEVPLLHGHAATDGRLATVTLDGMTTMHLPDPGDRVVVATRTGWVPGTVQDVVDLPGGEPAWAVALWTWDL